MGLLEAREDVAWAAPILVLILPHDLLTATEVVRHLLLSVIQGAVHSTVKNWIFILISLKFTWGELCKRPGLRLQIGSMPTSQLTRGSANDLWTFHWVSLCPNSIHWCVELYQLSNYKYDYLKHSPFKYVLNMKSNLLKTFRQNGLRNICIIKYQLHKTKFVRCIFKTWTIFDIA